jgi:hypothetical protein
MRDLLTINPDVFDIEHCLSHMLGHSFSFTDAETWHLLYLISNQPSGIWIVDGVVLSWTRLYSSVVVFFTN